MKIERCPFCGCSPNVKDAGGPRLPRYRVECHTCGLRGPSMSRGVPAVKLWNSVKCLGMDHLEEVL